MGLVVFARPFLVWCVAIMIEFDLKAWRITETPGIGVLECWSDGVVECVASQARQYWHRLARRRFMLPMAVKEAPRICLNLAEND
jgi:hypothetical protein